MITLKTAVYSSDRGYKWTIPPDEITMPQLSRYGATIERMYRDGMTTSDNIQGVIYNGNHVAIFSALKTAVGWDSAGRSTAYFALAFVYREQWPLVNFDMLLQNPFFLSPDKNPPTEIAYDGPVSTNVDEAVLTLFANGGKGPERMDFACLGNFLSVHFQLGLNWRFYRSNIQNWHGPELVFEKNQLIGAVAPRTASTVTDKAPSVSNGERKENSMALNDSTPELPSSDIAKFSVKVKCMRQDIDANRGQLQAMTQKVKLLTIAVVALLAVNLGLVAFVLFTSGVLSRVKQHDEKDDSLPKLEERLNKRKAKNGSLADASPTNIPAADGKECSANAFPAKLNGNTPKK